ATRFFRPHVVAGLLLKAAAHLTWHAFQAVNTRLPYGVKQPKWAPAPLMKSKDRTFPQLGFPRETDSLCPQCVKDVRESIVQGESDWRVLIDGKPGEIKAKIVERGNQIWMEKGCPRHGHFEDLMAMDADFLRRMERLYPGRDFRMAPDPFHNHGSSTIKYGRGAVLTIDLTNRCNMMCNPCFMDANQVGYVHELTLEEIQKILDDSISFKPRRQMSVQFSGGEPTLSPHFLAACTYAKKVGYRMVQPANTGGPTVGVRMQNHATIGGPPFQPVSFSGRDEEISDENRQRQRYTSSHLAHELARYYDGKSDPLRDWFPLGAGVAFAALADH